MRIFCFYCGKSVSSELPDDAVIRASLTCPECIEKQSDLVDNLKDMLESILKSRALARRRGWKSFTYWDGMARGYRNALILAETSHSPKALLKQLGQEGA